jgi:hypothetical protein
MSRERPILFNGDMVRAILEGRKTQTRRVVKPQPGNDNRIRWPGRKNIVINIRDDRVPQLCPYGQPGGRLWVRETHAIVPRTAYAMSDGADQVLRPDDSHDAAVFKAGWELSPPGRWRPSIHMPRWASRITLEVTDVRVERLQDISEEDAKAEGVWKYGDEDCWEIYTKTTSFGTSCPRRSFESLWQSINGPDSWNANPWVWVIEFRRLP